jgi:hypothetical protein
MGILTITGWWYTYSSEKYESQLGLLFPKKMGTSNSCSKQPNKQRCIVFILISLTEYLLGILSIEAMLS